MNARRVFFLGLAVAGLNAGPSTAADWAPIDCSQSKLQVLPGAKCDAMDSSGTGSKSGGATRIVSKSYSTRGTQDGILFNVSLQKPDSMGTFMTPATTEQRVSALKAFNDVTKNEAKNWSETERMGSALYLTFDRGAQRCFTFHDYGSPKGDGYAYAVSGFFCRKQAQALTNAEVRELIGKVQVK